HKIKGPPEGLDVVAPHVRVSAFNGEGIARAAHLATHHGATHHVHASSTGAGNGAIHAQGAPVHMGAIIMGLDAVALHHSAALGNHAIVSGVLHHPAHDHRQLGSTEERYARGFRAHVAVDAQA